MAARYEPGSVRKSPEDDPFARLGIWEIDDGPVSTQSVFSLVEESRGAHQGWVSTCRDFAAKGAYTLFVNAFVTALNLPDDDVVRHFRAELESRMQVEICDCLSGGDISIRVKGRKISHDIGFRVLQAMIAETRRAPMLLAEAPDPFDKKFVASGGGFAWHPGY